MTSVSSSSQGHNEEAVWRKESLPRNRLADANYVWDGEELPDKQASKEEEASYRKVFECDDGIFQSDKCLAENVRSKEDSIPLRRFEVKCLRPGGWVADECMIMSINLIQV